MTMRRGFLSDLFTGVVAKKLTLVETVTPFSRQHEFQGTRPFRELLGSEDHRQIRTRFINLCGEEDTITEDGFVSWSNVRKGKPRPPEYHLYYSANRVTEAMQVGDTMFLARRPDGSIMIVIAPHDSTYDAQLRWLFGFEEQPDVDVQFKDFEHDRVSGLSFAARYILDELGVEFEEEDIDLLDRIIAPLGNRFPSTAEFSMLARKSLPEVDPRDGADVALLLWVDREEALFKRLEHRIVSERLRAGFVEGDNADVDGFVAFSLTVQNRRKSRAGYALENHLEWIFKEKRLRFERGALTEKKSKPDFLFPGGVEYRDPSFPSERLTMLGSKSTLKDRWRQVLAEADRLDEKHLLTLEPSVSEPQTEEMRSKRLQLVVPKSLHSTYKPAQQSWLMDLDSFLALVETKQIP
jgi:hypothetical protein